MTETVRSVELLRPDLALIRESVEVAPVPPAWSPEWSVPWDRFKEWQERLGGWTGNHLTPGINYALLHGDNLHRSDDPAEVAEMARLFSGSAPIPSRKALCLAPQRLATPGRRR